MSLPIQLLLTWYWMHSLSKRQPTWRTDPCTCWPAPTKRTASPPPQPGWTGPTDTAAYFDSPPASWTWVVLTSGPGPPEKAGHGTSVTGETFTVFDLCSCVVKKHLRIYFEPAAARFMPLTRCRRSGDFRCCRVWLEKKSCRISDMAHHLAPLQVAKEREGFKGNLVATNSHKMSSLQQRMNGN